jgi:integrase/recombinase XerD
MESVIRQTKRKGIRKPKSVRQVGFRDKVMIYVMLDTMIRVSELLKTRKSNIDLKAGQIKLEPHETKMKRARTVPISTKT